MSGRPGLGWIVAGQFIGALADNALLLIAIEVLVERHAPAWTAPALRVAFYLMFVLLSAHASAIADAWPKKVVVGLVHVLKLCACVLLLWGVSPLVAYAVVGIGAAAHAPARYGILSELSAPGRLVAANAWLEGATVAAMVLGTVWGSLMLRGSAVLPAVSGSAAFRGTVSLAAAYLVAALCTLPVQGRAASNPGALRERALLPDFRRCVRVLWSDPAARISLSVTCAFWAMAAVLQFVVLRWASERLGLTLSGAGLLQAVVACGMIAGAAAAGRWIREDRAMALLPIGAVLGVALLLLPCFHDVESTAALLLLAGLLSGLLLVPMNTVLQRRGFGLMNPGQAIGVQTASENFASLAGLGLYGAAVVLQAALPTLVMALGALLSLVMLVPFAYRRRVLAD